MHRMIMALVVTGLIGGAALAQEEAAGAEPREPEQIRAQIEELEAQIRDLEKKEDIARETEWRREEYAEIQEETRERTADIAQELKDLAEDQAEEDEERTGAEKRFFESYVANLNARQAVCQRIAALEDYRQLDLAHELLREIESIERRWELLDGPKLEIEMELERLRREAAERPDRRLTEVLDRIELLARDEVHAIEESYKLWQQREENRRKYRDLREEFERSLHLVEAAAED